MNFKLYDRLYDGLNEHIKKSLNYAVSVQKKPFGDTFPMVVFKEISSTSISNQSFMESYSAYGYEIDIYAKSIGEKDGLEIAREICEVCSDLFDHQLKFKRIMCRPTPNIDTTIDRYTMQYQAKASDYRGRFY